jgi:hypothetical protein
MELLRDGAAADRVTPLEHEWAVTGLRKVEGRNEGIVPAADDHDRAHVRSQELGVRS